MCDRKHKPAEGQSWSSFYAEKTKELTDDLSRWLNSYTGDEQREQFVEAVMSDHRTLQQSTMREVVLPLLQAWAAAYARGEYHYDLRNEWTCKFAFDLLRLYTADGGWVPPPRGVPFI